MSEQNTRPNVGQDNIDPTATPNVDLLEELEVLHRDIERIRCTCERLHSRIVAKCEHQKSADEANEAPDTEPKAVLTPPLALRCDGRALLSIAELHPDDAAARDTWTGAVLTEAEASDVLDMLDHAYQDAAGNLGGAIRARARKPKLEGEEAR